MIDVPTRLRRALLRNDLALVKRIVKNNPSYLQNPDFADKSNTALHLAAQHGFLEIVEFLVTTGHDSSTLAGERGISLNTDSSTPLHLAASYSQAPIVSYLCNHFPQTIDRPDCDGTTALMLASRAHPPAPLTPIGFASKPSSSPDTSDTTTIETLIAHNASVTLTDDIGNTPLHYASAWGNLKAIRVLVAAGVDPLAKNAYAWTAVNYCSSVQAEVYVKQFVAEWEKKKVEEEQLKGRMRGKGGLRLVVSEEEEEGDWRGMGDDEG